MFTKEIIPKGLENTEIYPILKFPSIYQEYDDSLPWKLVLYRYVSCSAVMVSYCPKFQIALRHH